MDTITKTYTIHAPIEDIWNALTDPHEINEWGAGPAVMSEKEGDEFSLWGGEIHGKNIEVEQNELLKQEWYGGDWKKPSLVTFSFTEEDDVTKVEIVHTQFPAEEYRSLEEGWDEDYFTPLIDHLENQNGF